MKREIKRGDGKSLFSGPKTKSVKTKICFGYILFDSVWRELSLEKINKCLLRMVLYGSGM